MLAAAQPTSVSFTKTPQQQLLCPEIIASKALTLVDG
jgi:hypothetical protein